MRWLLFAALFVIGVIVWLTIYLQPNSFLGCADIPDQSESCGPADAIVVVSGGDTVARTQTGITLFNNGWADTLIFSGAAQDKSGPSNAAAMKQQALSAGIPEEAIIIEEESENTQQNAENTRRILEDTASNDIILVTSGYHQRRASLEFKNLSDTIAVRNYPVINDKDWSWFWWLTPRGWWLAGGEVVKIVAFHVGASS